MCVCVCVFVCNIHVYVYSHVCSYVRVYVSDISVCMCDTSTQKNGVLPV